MSTGSSAAVQSPTQRAAFLLGQFTLCTRIRIYLDALHMATGTISSWHNLQQFEKANSNTSFCFLPGGSAPRTPVIVGLRPPWFIWNSYKINISGRPKADYYRGSGGRSPSVKTKHWVLDSESGFFWIFMIFKENRSFLPRYMSKKSRDVFSGEKKAPAAKLLGI